MEMVGIELVLGDYSKLQLLGQKQLTRQVGKLESFGQFGKFELAVIVGVAGLVRPVGLVVLAELVEPVRFVVLAVNFARFESVDYSVLFADLELAEQLGGPEQPEEFANPAGFVPQLYSVTPRRSEYQNPLPQPYSVPQPTLPPPAHSALQASQQSPPVPIVHQSNFGY